MDAEDIKSAIRSLIMAAERCNKSVSEECLRLRTAACQIEQIIMKQQDCTNEHWNERQVINAAQLSGEADESVIKHQDNEIETLKIHLNTLRAAIAPMKQQLDGSAAKRIDTLNMKEKLQDENRILRNQIQNMRSEIEKLRTRAEQAEALEKVSHDNKIAETLHERALGLYKKTKRAVKYILSEYGQHAKAFRSTRGHDKVQSYSDEDGKLYNAFETINEIQKTIASDKTSGVGNKRERHSSEVRCTNDIAIHDLAARGHLDQADSTVDIPCVSDTSRKSHHRDKSESRKRWAPIDYEENHRRKIDVTQCQYPEPPSKHCDRPNYKFTEVVRNKEKRKEMRGYACECCDKFYKAMDSNQINSCSRHRAHFTPPCTAPDFWKVGFDEEETCPPADSGNDESS